MSIFVVAALRFTEEDRYRSYQQRFLSVFNKFDGRLLVADESPLQLEGSTNLNKIVIMEFPSKTSAFRFLNSHKYIEISEDRHAGARTDSFLVSGINHNPEQSS